MTTLTKNELMALADSYTYAYSSDVSEGTYGPFSQRHEARATLSDALEAVCRDAERYRWLFDDAALVDFKRCCETGDPLPDTRTNLLHQLLGFVISRELIDAAIDAAMKEAK